MYSYEHPHPAVTADIVVFTIRDDQLKLLLIRRAFSPHKGKWALPGGFVDISEGLDEAASRELKEETGVSDVYLEQLYTFGKPRCDPRERVITVAYYALIPSDKMQLQAATDAEAVGWFGMDELPKLAFDHTDIVTMAHQRLSLSSTIQRSHSSFYPNHSRCTSYKISMKSSARKSSINGTFGNGFWASARSKKQVVNGPAALIAPQSFSK